MPVVVAARPTAIARRVRGAHVGGRLDAGVRWVARAPVVPGRPVDRASDSPHVLPATSECGGPRPHKSGPVVPGRRSKVRGTAVADRPGLDNGNG